MPSRERLDRRYERLELAPAKMALLSVVKWMGLTSVKGKSKVFPIQAVEALRIAGG
jgi:hypothetical protein